MRGGGGCGSCFGSRQGAAPGPVAREPRVRVCRPRRYMPGQLPDWWVPVDGVVVDGVVVDGVVVVLEDEPLLPAAYAAVPPTSAPTTASVPSAARMCPLIRSHLLPVDSLSVNATSLGRP